MCARPRRRVAQLFMRRLKPSEVFEVLASWTLIGGGIELEEDLIAPVGDVEHQTAPLATVRAVDRATRETEIQQRPRACVYPIGRDTKHASRILDRSRQCPWQRCHRENALPLYLASDVDVARGPSDQTQQLQSPAANRVQLVAQPALLQQLSECGEGCSNVSLDAAIRAV